MKRYERCPTEITLQVIGGRWKIVILFHLFERAQRFSELQRALGGVTQKVLTQQLRELEADGIVRRKVYPQVPPKVEYSLTPRGETLRPVIDAICEWGERQQAAMPELDNQDGEVGVEESSVVRRLRVVRRRAGAQFST